MQEGHKGYVGAKQMSKIHLAKAVAYAEKNFGGGVQDFGRPRRGSGGRRPPEPENFQIFAKKFRKKNAKNALF